MTGKSIMQTLLNYLAGISIFLVYTAGLPVIAFFFIREVTNGFDRNMSGGDFLFGLFLVLLTLIMVPLGTIGIYRLLKRKGKMEMANGMLVGLFVAVAAHQLGGIYVDKQEEKSLRQLEEEKQRQRQMGLEGQNVQQELEETRRQLQNEWGDPVFRSDSVK